MYVCVHMRYMGFSFSPFVDSMNHCGSTTTGSDKEPRRKIHRSLDKNMLSCPSGC